jgi:Ion channel
MSRATAKKPKGVGSPPDGAGELEDKWVLERGARKAFDRVKKICPFWWFIDGPEETSKRSKEFWDLCRAGWLFVWLVLLIGLWWWNPEGLFLKIICGGFAALRLFEVAMTGIGTTLDDENQVRARSMMTIGVYFMQLAFAFAILYHSFAATHFDRIEGATTEPARDAPDYLYISWANITSLGNNSYIPTNDAARFLEVLTTTFGILLLGVLLAFGIDAVKKHGEGTKPGSAANDGAEP